MLATYVSHQPQTHGKTLEKMDFGKARATANRHAMEQKVTPRQPKPRVSRMKGHLSKRTAFVREIVREVSGYVGRLGNPQAAIGRWNRIC